MGRLSRPEFDKLKWPTNYREPLCYRASFATGHSDNGIVQNMDWTGLDWTGQLDWTIGLDSWTGQFSKNALVERSYAIGRFVAFSGRGGRPITAFYHNPRNME